VLVGGTGTVLEGGGGAAPPEFFLNVGGRAGVGLFGFAGTSLIAPVLRNFGMPPANNPANPGGPPPICIGGAPPPGLMPPDEVLPPELPPVFVSIKAALRSFFSESFTFLSFFTFFN